MMVYNTVIIRKILEGEGFSMAGSIRINPDQVRGVASQFRQKSQESASMCQQLQTAVKGMEGEWQGMSAQRFYSDYTQWNQQMLKYVDLLNGIASELDKIATTLETTDQQLAGH
jgi:WXG100 family type VII secretion target